MHRPITLAAALLLLIPNLARAQVPRPNPAPPTNSIQSDCAPGTTGSGQSGDDLSEKLARSNGVICPPANIDPNMRVPPPQGGTLKVVPPPGTPGGDQGTVPK